MMQKRKTIGTLALVAAMTVALGSVATAADKTELEQKFEAADKDGDGKLTKAEADAGMPRVAKNFKRLDKDGKGYVTLDQLKAAADR
jgi:Ca2+-binding EF-hand superfamily protein